MMNTLKLMCDTVRIKEKYIIIIILINKLLLTINKFNNKNIILNNIWLTTIIEEKLESKPRRGRIPEYR